MAHKISFKNCENNWSSALPLGNGVFGAMVFYEDGVLSLPMNHYEVYYTLSDTVLPQDILRAQADEINPGAKHQSVVQRAERNLAPEGEPYCPYHMDRINGEPYAHKLSSKSDPATGELRIYFDPALRDGDSELTLNIESAQVDFTLCKGADSLHLNIWIAREDCLVIRAKLSRPGLICGTAFWNPPARDRKEPEYTYLQPDNNTAAYRVHRAYSSGKTFDFSVALRSVGTTCPMSLRKNSAHMELGKDSTSFQLLVGVFTQWRYTELPDLAKLDTFRDTEKLLRDHAAYWQEFFSRGNISLPDKFLEKVWYVSQYTLDCCSGRDRVMKHHACGLNGLWAIRHPNIWGSKWYWDVNIQAAFAGVFSSNRLELGKVFSDGLLSYVELAKNFAWDTHKLPGIAMDYPHAMYYCIWPWCAQYLWAQYEYSQDLEYLRKEAYPVFLGLCEFAVQLFQWDEERNCYSVYPDICPEQGPFAHNSTVTVAAVKYLLTFTLEAARLLDDHPATEADIRKLLENLPPYANNGSRFMDSEDAPADLWLRHPSVLIPIFPIGEIDLDSDPTTRAIAENTLDFLEENCEIGGFQGSWVAAAAARLGQGQQALRILYEQGIDHMLRSNGLCAEATDRFLNFCLTLHQPLYYPCMMEYTGQMPAAVNEMLLQSHGGVIRIFPALPDGDPGYFRDLRHSCTEFYDRYAYYPAWKDVRFTNLLARGAFEVDAELSGGKLRYVRIRSKAGSSVRVTSPVGLSDCRVTRDEQEVPFRWENNILSFETQAGGTYEILPAVSIPPMAEAADRDINEHLTYTKHRILIGGDSDTPYYRALDNFIRDWYFGDVRMENRTVYRFDFTASREKDYASAFVRQALAAQPGEAIKIMRILPVDAEEFTVRRGYGFASSEGISLTDAGSPDMLRRDYVQGSDPATFLIEVPRGQYELFVVSGSATEETATSLDVENGRRTEGDILPPGRFQCKILPLVMEREGQIRLRVSGAHDKKWCMNLLFVNAIKGY